MNKIRNILFVLALLCLASCSNLFISYCDRVARGTADRNWVTESMTQSIPFSKVTYRDPTAGSPGAVCITAQGESAELAAGKNFSFEIDDAKDNVIVKKNGKSPAQPIDTSNQTALWSGKNQTNKNTFESTECFNIAKLDPFVKIKVKKLNGGDEDESKLWAGAAYCKR